MLGLKIFRNDKGIAIARARIEVFVMIVYFRNALIVIPSPSITTRKNQSRMTVFHLYFIKRKIIANAKAKEMKI